MPLAASEHLPAAFLPPPARAAEQLGCLVSQGGRLLGELLHSLALIGEHTTKRVRVDRTGVAARGLCDV
jgi:hypothetical protein